MSHIKSGDLFIGDATSGSIYVDGITAIESDGVGGVLTLQAHQNDKGVSFVNTDSVFNTLTVQADMGLFSLRT